MSAPSYPAPNQYPPQGYFPPPPAPKNGLGTAGFVLGLLGALFAMIPIVGVIAWPMVILGLVIGLLGISRARKGVANNKGIAVAGTVLSTIGLVLCIGWLAAFGSAAEELSTDLDAVAAAPAAPVGAAPAEGAPLPFGETWTSDNGNTIVVGQPEVGPSESSLSTVESVISVPVTLTNNGTEEWSTVFTTFGGTLDGRPAVESFGEGDAMYSTPLAPGASVTLTKVFEGGPGEFTLTASTPHGVAFFTGQV